MRILLVEDSIADALLLKQLIEDQGSQCTLINTKEELFKCALADFDFAIVDLNLPDSGAEETLRDLEHVEIPKAVITGHGEPHLAYVAGYELGLPLLMKPGCRMDIEMIAMNIIGMAERAHEHDDELRELRSIFQNMEQQQHDAV